MIDDDDDDDDDDEVRLPSFLSFPGSVLLVPGP
jgi:hypothetical protein